jgi:hypothetical protein
MNSSAKHWLGVTVALLLPIQWSLAKEKSDKKTDDKSAKESGGGINLPIPIGHEAKGVKLPYTGPDGRIQMNFSIAKVKRLDEQNLQMVDLLIETFDEAGARDMTFDLPASIYNTESRIILSKNPVKISRSDFELTGETMQFNTTTRQGVLRGKVRMLIFNRDDISGRRNKE